MLLKAVRKRLERTRFGAFVVERIISILLAKPRRIRSGPGKGLLFCGKGGGLPGQVLGTTDLDEQLALARTLRNGQTFYDIGANIGFFRKNNG
jgi:hypothetical protein